MAAAKKIIEDHRDTFPAAMKCLEQGLEESLAVLKFPFAHRTKIIPRFTSEASGLSLTFAVLEDASEGWRGVRMKPYLQERLRQMIEDPDSEWEDPGPGETRCLVPEFFEGVMHIQFYRKEKT